LARSEILYNERNSRPNSSRFSDPGAFTEFLLGKNTSFQEAYCAFVGEDFYQGLGNKSQEQLYKDEMFKMKKVAKAENMLRHIM